MCCKRNFKNSLAYTPAPKHKPADDAPVWLKLHELRVDAVAHECGQPDHHGINNNLALSIKGIYNDVSAEIKTPFDKGMAEELRKMYNHDVEIYIVRAGTEVIIK